MKKLILLILFPFIVNGMEPTSEEKESKYIIKVINESGGSVFIIPARHRGYAKYAYRPREEKLDCWEFPASLEQRAEFDDLEVPINRISKHFILKVIARNTVTNFDENFFKQGKEFILHVDQHGRITINASI